MLKYHPGHTPYESTQITDPEALHFKTSLQPGKYMQTQTEFDSPRAKVSDM